MNRAAFLLMLTASAAMADDVYVLSWSTLDGGGGLLSAEGFELRGTIGQPDAGILSAEGLVLESGYWVSDPAGGRAPCIADFNRDGFIDFFDYDNFVLVFEMGFGAADVNGDDFIDFFDYDLFVESFERGC